MVYNCTSTLQSQALGKDYTCTEYVITSCQFCKLNNTGEVDWNDVTHHYQIHGRAQQDLLMFVQATCTCICMLHLYTPAIDTTQKCT